MKPQGLCTLMQTAQHSLAQLVPSHTSVLSWMLQSTAINTRC